jgi:hypothetical protein
MISGSKRRRGSTKFDYFVLDFLYMYYELFQIRLHPYVVESGTLECRKYLGQVSVHKTK